MTYALHNKAQFVYKVIELKSMVPVLYKVLYEEKMCTFVQTDVLSHCHAMILAFDLKYLVKIRSFAPAEVLFKLSYIENTNDFKMYHQHECSVMVKINTKAELII